MKPDGPVRPRTPRLPLWVILLVALAGFLWAAFLGNSHLNGERSLLDRMEAPLADLRLLLAGRRIPPGNVVIVAIDDSTVALEGRYPLDRATLARLLDIVISGEPAALAIDLLLVDQTSPELDRQLALRLGRVPTVLAAAAQFREHAQGSDDLPGVPRADAVLWPAAPFKAAASTGLVNIAKDPAGIPRHLPLLFQTNEGLATSFALRAATIGNGHIPAFAADRVRIGDRTLRLDLASHLPLRFYGPRGTVETISARALLEGTVKPSDLAGRIVVVGTTATAVGDTFSTPFDAIVPGVEILATGIGNIVAGEALIRDRVVRGLDVAFGGMLAVGGVLLVGLLPLSAGLGLVLLALVAWFAATIVAFRYDYWLSVVLPLAVVIPAVDVMAVIRQGWDSRQARLSATAEASLRRFQSPVLAERIARDPGFLAEPVLQNAAILFVDLSGFTRLSEQIGPEETRAFLKQFHTLIEDASDAHGGVVLSFMGDGAMVVFGLPDESPDDALNAFAAGWAMIDDVARWEDHPQLPEGPLSLRVGIHYGPVVMSRLGHEAHQHITASGDSVNVASRLMEVAKSHGAVVAVSAELLAAIPPTARRSRGAGETRAVEIRGRRRPMSVSLWRMPDRI